MKIVKEHDKTRMKYGDLATGDVFIFNNNVFMKTDIQEEPDEPNDFCSVELSSGTKFLVGNDVQVKLVEAELHISERGI